MDEFKESIKDLKKQLSDFIDNYYKELIKIWSSISVVETKLKLAGIIYGGVSGIVFSVITYLIINKLKQ